MPPASLSDRQQRMLAFIRDFTRRRGYPPTVRDIGAAVGISSISVVDYNLDCLERRGLLRRSRGVSRGLELVEEGQRSGAVVVVPVVGRIAAGEPIEAMKERDHEWLLLSAAVAPEGCFALRVRGKSMIEDLIDDGDVVVVRPQETADDGDIVVALLNNDLSETPVATLKRIYRERERVRLQPANAQLEPIYVDPAALRIQGKVIALMRRM